jgi:hypothetical protein
VVEVADETPAEQDQAGSPEEVASDAEQQEEPSPRRRATRERIERPFPRRTLEQALRVPKAIKEHNGGNPWPADEVAKAALRHQAW